MNKHFLSHVTVLPRMHRHASMSRDDHFNEEEKMVSILTCRYKVGFALSKKLSPFSYTSFIIQICLTFIHFPFGIDWKVKFILAPIIIQYYSIYHLNPLKISVFSSIFVLKKIILFPHLYRHTAIPRGYTVILSTSLHTGMPVYAGQYGNCF